MKLMNRSLFVDTCGSGMPAQKQTQIFSGMH